MALDPPELDWRGATPIARRFGDIYYSPEDALGEVRHNFVSCVAPWFGARPVLVIGETGFGTGLNFLLTWHDWRQRRRREDRLIFVSTEAYPLRRQDAERALQPFAPLRPLAAALLARWPVGIPGPHRRFFDQGKVELWVLHGQAHKELQRQQFQADAWYFDGFNPATNPDLWGPKVLSECARLMAPGSIGGSFTVASGVCAALAAVGLSPEKRPGFGRKRDCLSVYKPGTPLPRAALPSPPAGGLTVMGQGIAGASLIWAAGARGVAARTHGPAQQQTGVFPTASGNPAALVNFKPTKAPHTQGNRLLAAALAHVQPLYADLWQAGRGTFKPAQNAGQFLEFEACHAAMGWSPEALSMGSLAELANRPGLLSPLAGYVAPLQVLDALREADLRQGLQDTSDEGGLPVWAQGYGVLSAAPSIAAFLRRNLGQVDVFDASACPDVPMPLTYAGYVTPRFGTVREKVLAGSTYDRDPDWDAPTLWDARQKATDQIVAKALAAGLSLPARAAQSHVGVRAFGKDQLPIVGQTLEGAWVLTGLGSRGFLTAPLLAEILLDEVEARAAAGLPTYDFKTCVHPTRFVQ